MSKPQEEDNILEDNEIEYENYKGVYYDDTNEEKYYEGGAHFKYEEMCLILERVYAEVNSDRRRNKKYKIEGPTEQKELEKDINGKYILIYTYTYNYI